ncbi:MAG TPA: hypothetical protein VIW68_12570 [Candidatus Sulfotelmatobacter sp.]
MTPDPLREVIDKALPCNCEHLKHISLARTYNAGHANGCPLFKADVVYAAVLPLFEAKDRQLSELEGIDKVCDFAHENIGKLQADLEAKDAEVKKLREALSELCTKLEEIEKHPSYLGIFSLAHCHGILYSGPNWKDSLERARAALGARKPNEHEACHRD